MRDSFEQMTTRDAGIAADALSAQYHVVVIRLAIPFGKSILGFRLQQYAFPVRAPSRSFTEYPGVSRDKYCTLWSSAAALSLTPIFISSPVLPSLSSACGLYDAIELLQVGQSRGMPIRDGRE